MIQSRSQLLGQNPPGPVGNRTAEGQDIRDSLHQVLQFFLGKGPEQTELHQTDLFAGLPEPVHSQANGSSQGTAADNDLFGPFQPVPLQIGIAAVKKAAETRSARFDFPGHALHGFGQGLPEGVKIVRRGCGPETQGIVRIQMVGRLIGRQKPVHQVLLRHEQLLHGMGQDKPVDHDHHRKHDPFRQPVGQKDGIQGFLGGFTIDLQPAGVSLGQAVTLIGPDIPGRAKGSIGIDHDQREPGTGKPVQHFMHQGQTVGTRRGEGSAASGHGPEAGGDGRHFGLDLDIFAGHGSAVHHAGQGLDNMGLRGDGISGDDLRPAELDPKGNGVASQEHFSCVLRRRVLQSIHVLTPRHRFRDLWFPVSALPLAGLTRNYLIL